MSEGQDLLNMQTRATTKGKDKVPAARNEKDLNDPLLITVSKLADRVGETEQVISQLAELPEVLKKQGEMIDRMYSHMNSVGMTEEETMDSDYVIDDDNYSEGIPVAPPPLTNNFLSLLQESSDVGSPASNEQVPDEILNIFKERNAKPATFGDPLKESVMNLYKDLLYQVTDKNMMDRLRDAYKTPENLPELRVPKMNAELWSVLETSTLSAENSLYSSLEPVVCSLIANARLVDLVSTHAAAIPKEIGNTMMTLISDCAAGLAATFRDLNTRRRLFGMPGLSLFDCTRRYLYV